ncbi:DNA adenine methylase [Lactobacillus intestinalis]|uniref:DNA adenine methylase n=2 Tax=Bacillota TaxID=1239 RepID=UPI0025B58130|nr:DNA adenine methylase [Lactobacillus intestinalis]
MSHSPLRYPGGKYKLFRFVKSLIKENQCNTYIEPFCGGSGLALELLIKGYVKKIILNDFDYTIYALWKIIVENPEQLISMINDTSVTLDEWNNQKYIRAHQNKYSELEIAFSTLFLNRTNRSGIIDKAGPIGGKNQDGNYKLDCRFNKNKIIENIRIIASYSNSIEVYNLEASQFLKEVVLDKEDYFIFFDPPYFKKGKELYLDFLDYQGHQQIANVISKNLKKAKWIVTYDDADEIREMYKFVNCRPYYLQYSLQKKQRAIELLFPSDNLLIPESADGIQFVD